MMKHDTFLTMMYKGWTTDKFTRRLLVKRKNYSIDENEKTGEVIIDWENHTAYFINNLLNEVLTKIV